MKHNKMNPINNIHSNTMTLFLSDKKSACSFFVTWLEHNKNRKYK